MGSERCTRCCLNNSMRVVNLIVNLCGIGMIVYSLWLQKMWNDGVAQLAYIGTTALPRPWFIYTCLGIGIAVCLSTLVGYMVANCITKPTLFIYITSLCSLLSLQVGVIVAIFFKADWGTVISKYIDEHHKKFRSFVLFHAKMCRLIIIMAVLAQISVVVVAVILWVVGTQPSVTRPRLRSYRQNFIQSFLVIPNPSSSLQDCLRAENCTVCEELDQMTQQEGFGFASFIKGVFRIRLFDRRTTINV